MASAAWLGPLYEQFREELFLTAWTTLRRREQAEDAVHAAVVKLAALPTPPDDAKLYLFRCVRNAAIDLLRAQARRAETGLAHDDWFPAPDAAAPGAFDEETLASVRALVETLDARSRETIELRLHANLTFREIADLLNEPLPTVASRYRRALERLGERLQAPHE
ncbi:MAG TPA: sigma-70 family RNA polymerase sigma factor [Pirellulaceae bacterium]|jgi:RNA polymerase sigma-70 factor (ECF subfamily)|nr:sigma-70 family RNA polymerase sigma factor [Pirellulaceae bacterium]